MMYWKEFTTLAVVLQLVQAVPTRRQASTCSGTFSPISAQTWADGMNPGWNLGNTLDAIPNEGDWGNPPVDFTTFDDVKKAGFTGVRLPGMARPATTPRKEGAD